VINDLLGNNNVEPGKMHSQPHSMIYWGTTTLNPGKCTPNRTPL
jgi:hypothetical protein